MIGLNPVQTAMQVAIPEIDGATEPFIFGGLSSGKDHPEALPDRCSRIASRLKRWNRLRSLPRADVRLAFLIYCFPPGRGNLGTAADLDVFCSLWEILRRLVSEGYTVTVPDSPEMLREMLLSGDDIARIAYFLPTIIIASALTWTKSKPSGDRRPAALMRKDAISLSMVSS
jgi:magnesium chelatase subunit H